MKQVLRVCTMLMALLCLISVSAHGEEPRGKTMELYLSNNGNGSWELEDGCPDDVVLLTQSSFAVEDSPLEEVVFCFELRGVSPGTEYVALKWIRDGAVYMYADMEVRVDEALQPSIVHFELVPGIHWEDEALPEEDETGTQA